MDFCSWSSADQADVGGAIRESGSRMYLGDSGVSTPNLSKSIKGAEDCGLDCTNYTRTYNLECPEAT